MAEAAIGGREATLDAAIAAAAEILAASRCAIIAGLGTDVGGAEAAIALARQIGGVVDHMHSAALLRDLSVMREAGWIVASMAQARALADLVLLVGPGPGGSWREAAERLRLDAAPPLAPGAPRRVIRFCCGNAEMLQPAGRTETIGAEPEDLPVLLGAQRALIAGRRVGDLGRHAEALAALARALRDARYGVAVWSAGAIDTLAIEMLCGVIDDLNAHTRFAGLPLPPADNATGVAQAATWRTGFPVRIGFGRGRPEHDPWRFDAGRMVASGEADAAMWISACSAAAPPWRGTALPIIALVAEGTRFETAPEVAITVGRPGDDHDSVLYDQHFGVLAGKPAADARDLARVADVLGRIAARLPTAPC